MIDISEKIETLRTAVAESRVIAKQETIERALRGETPKGDVLNVARAAGALAAKKTWELIPYCHPLALDSVVIQFEPKPTELLIRVAVKTIARTGVEMEALTAASIAALTIYDMMKGIDKEVAIGETRLVEKRGGKSDFQEEFQRPLKGAVLVTSDSVSAGKKSDKSGKMIVEAMQKFPVAVVCCEVVPDEKEVIRKKILGWIDEKIDLILTTGGTGLGPRDVTVEATQGVIEREIPGIMEAGRSYGQNRTPYAMLSRGLAVQRGNTLIINLPGSSNGVRETLNAIFPALLHAYPMMGGGGH